MGVGESMKISYYLNLNHSHDLNKRNLYLIGTLDKNNQEWFNVKGYKSSELPDEFKEIVEEITSWADWLKVIDYLGTHNEIETGEGAVLSRKELLNIVKDSKKIPNRKSSIAVNNPNPEDVFYDKEGFCVFMRG